MISFDHCFVRRFSRKKYQALDRFGFNTNVDYCVEHEGRQFCRFIKIKNSYLEFIDIPNYRFFLTVLRKNNELPCGTGISFRLDSSLRYRYKMLKEGFVKYGIKFIHKNYEWKKDSKSKLPGWNFLTFEREIIEGMNIWFTEYEDTPARKRRQSVLRTDHSNKVTDVCGLIIDFPNEKAKHNLRKMLRISAEEDPIFLNSRFKIYEFSKHSLPCLKFKKTPLKAVLLKTKNWKETKRWCQKCAQVDFDGKRAIHIPLLKTSYDILVIE